MSKSEKRAVRAHTFGDLYDLLADHFPKCRTSRDGFDVQGLGRLLGYSNETMYKAVRETEPLKLGVAYRIVKVSHENQDANPIFWADLTRFVLPEYTRYAEPTDVDDLLG